MTTDITQLDAQGQPIDDAAEAALDKEIEWLGVMAARARLSGYCTEATLWLDHRSRVIASRTPAHQARLAAEHLARVEADNAAFLGRCYFLDMAEADAKRLEGAA